MEKANPVKGPIFSQEIAVFEAMTTYIEKCSVWDVAVGEVLVCEGEPKITSN